MTILDAIKSLGPSIVRTVAPFVVGWLIVLAAHAGLDWTPSDEVRGFVTLIVSALWYAVVRYLEENVGAGWGRLLGWRGAPTYEDHQ